MQDLDDEEKEAELDYYKHMIEKVLGNSQYDAEETKGESDGD